eukprot:scaffold9802_cov54-Phaeocystis_antarctica.AAC.2
MVNQCANAIQPCCQGRRELGLACSADTEGPTEAAHGLGEAELPKASHGPREAEGRLAEKRDGDGKREEELCALPKLHRVRPVALCHQSLDHRLAQNEFQAKPSDAHDRPQHLVRGLGLGLGLGLG